MIFASIVSQSNRTLYTVLHSFVVAKSVIVAHCNPPHNTYLLHPHYMLMMPIAGDDTIPMKIVAPGGRVEKRRNANKN